MMAGRFVSEREGRGGGIIAAVMGNTGGGRTVPSAIRLTHCHLDDQLPRTLLNRLVVVISQTYDQRLALLKNMATDLNYSILAERKSK